MRPNMAMTSFVSRCFHGEPPVIFDDGSKTRDFTHVDDIVHVNDQHLTDDRADGEILNLGSTDNIDIETLATVIRDEIGPSLELEYSDPRRGDAEHTHADISKQRTCSSTNRRRTSAKGSRNSSTGIARIRTGMIRSSETPEPHPPYETNP